jgi:tetratricopeptide (TPR) repeat protein
VAGVDPSVNTALFQVAALLDLPGGANRVIVGLRDPRHDVRAGACVGLQRLAEGAVNNGNRELEARVVAVLGDSKTRIETRTEIARICANVGFGSALEGARTAAAEAIRLTKKLADDTLARLENPPLPNGIWVDLGVDAGEAAARPRAKAWMAILGVGEGVLADEKGVRSAVPADPMRVLSVRRPEGEGTTLAVQLGLTTWWAADGDDICDFGDRVIAQKAWNFLDAVDGALGQGAAALRTRGAALLARNRVDEAILALEASVSGKKVPADAWWFLAGALHAAGRDEEARPHLEKYLQKAAKKAPFVDEARRRLG